jgi:hypothetical protein
MLTADLIGFTEWMRGPNLCDPVAAGRRRLGEGEIQERPAGGHDLELTY